MSKRLITIYSNETQYSLDTKAELVKILSARGYVVTSEYSDQTSLIFCIGGDGSFLEAIHSFNFPDCPIVGVNTGHLGFFQEIKPEQMEAFMDSYEKGEYQIQKLNTVKCTVKTKFGLETEHYALNEVVISGRKSSAIHLDISIGNTPIERFSGDGILVATSAGSTAYNYSLRGSIVDPRLKLLQVTPISPVNTTAFRTLTSSVLLPSDLSLGIIPVKPSDRVYIANDAIITSYLDVESIDVEMADKTVDLIRFQDYSFWGKVRDKFL